MQSESPSPPIAPASPAVESSDRRAPLQAQAWANHPIPEAIESATLLQGGKSVTISHNGTAYRLQATRQGKLILTK